MAGGPRSARSPLRELSRVTPPPQPGSGHGVRNVLMTCSNDAGHGGVQVVFRDLVRSLERDGRRVYLLYQDSTTRLRLRQAVNGWGRLAFYCPLPTMIKDSLLLSLPLTLVYLPLVVFHLARLIRRHKIDVINAHYLAEYFVHLALVARLLRVPLIISVHGADVDQYAPARPVRRLLLRLAMRGAQRIVACSSAMADETARVFPSARAKITHVHNGLVLDDVPAPRTAGGVSGPFVLSVARQVTKKGTDTLLCAFALVHHDVPDVMLVVIGDGPELGKNRALAETLGIAHRVQFLGDRTRDETLVFFSACSLFVLPSRVEPFGLVLLEAACYKRPIVATAVGGIPEILTDGVNAFLVPPDDPAAMADKMKTLLANPRLGDRFGTSAHASVLARFRWDDRVRDYVAVYEDAERAARHSRRPRGLGHAASPYLRP